MANLAATLKEEVTRLARKELKTETGSLKKNNSRHRLEIAELKRRVSQLERQLKAVLKNIQKQPAQVEQPADKAKLRFRADGFKKHRERLGLSAAALGRMLDVSLQTVYNWESGKTKPSKEQVVKIAALRKMGKREAMAHLQSE